jgi:endoglucanase
MGCLLLGMTCCWVRHDGDRLVGHLGSTRAAIVVEPDAVAADCFNTRRAILLKHSVRRLANAGQYVDLDAGYARWRTTGEMAHRLLRAGIQYVQGFSVNVANRQTTRQSYWWGGSSRTSSAGAEFVSTPPATASALLRMSRTGTTSRAIRDARHWARPPRPGRACRGWPRCSGASSPASRTASAGARPPIFSRTRARRLTVNSLFAPAEGRQLAAAADVSPTGRGRGHRKLVRWTRPGTL